MEAIKIEKKSIEAGQDFFEKYIASFLKNKDQQIIESLILREKHSKHVAQISRFISEKILLDEEEQQLAELIGLWHDLGRFQQFEKYQTFNDAESENHAELGAVMIQDQEFYKNLSEFSQEVIVKAIRYHNLPALPVKEDKQVLLFSQILRDADKLDIWDICVSNLERDGSFKIPSINYNLPKTGIINEAVLKSIMQQKSVSKKDLKSLEDFKLFLISMVFDLNFKVSFRILSEKQMVKKIYDTLPKKDVVFDAYREIRLFIENKFVI
ncbi:HD domain-containing protein [Sunxiuqinia sp. A32]|uniref:HD domain-containing protein n=1 Tax=Sunxiuqinia sp. A32 TaxID=3461496 RepID=UPI0040461F9B